MRNVPISKKLFIAYMLVASISLCALRAEARVPAEASCRVYNQHSGFSNVGSGTLIDCADNPRSGLVLSCWHLFREGTGKVVVQFASGRTYGARVVALDESADLAALVIANPLVQPVKVAFELEPRANLTACGYGQSGQYRCVSGLAVGTSDQQGQTSVLLGNAVRTGDSGGGVFNERGQLVAVVWGQRDGVTYASCGRPLRNFVGRVLGRKQQVVLNCPNGLCPRPAIPEPALPLTPIPRQPQQSQILDREESSIFRDSRLDRLSADVERLERDKQPSGDYATRQQLDSQQASILEKVKSLASSRSAGVGKHVGSKIATALRLSGPAGWAVLAVGTVGGWLVGRGMKNRLNDARGRRRPFLGK